MGNGESTSRRISMQRSDEGTIQISENVMLRLSKQKPPRPDNEVTLEPGEIVIQEQDVKRMLDKAFQKGQNTAITKLQAEQEQMAAEQKRREEQRETEYEKQLQMLAAYWKEQFEIETSKVRDITLEDNEAFEKMQSELTEKEKGLMGEKQYIDSQKEELSAFQDNLSSEKETLLSKYQSLTQEKESLDGEKLTLDQIREGLREQQQLIEEERNRLTNEQTKLSDEKARLTDEEVRLSDTVARLTDEEARLTGEKAKLEEENVLVSREKMTLEERQRELHGKLLQREQELNDEFERISSEVDRKIKPLQAKTICSDSQSNVLKCYRQHKKQPLRCTKEVQEFANCVQTARVKMMEKGLNKEA